LKQRIGRQARIVKENITQEEIEQIIASDDPVKFMREAMRLSGVLVDAVAELERMRRIEQGVREILELFQDLATLVKNFKCFEHHDVSIQYSMDLWAGRSTQSNE
jgi:syntaxin 1B/2/3